MARKPSAHTVYTDSLGTRVPGATTIIGILDKPALIKWANNLGLAGIDSTKYELRQPQATAIGAARRGTTQKAELPPTKCSPNALPRCSAGTDDAMLAPDEG